MTEDLGDHPCTLQKKIQNPYSLGTGYISFSMLDIDYQGGE